MSILLLAEHDNHILSDQTAKALSAVLQIGGDIDVLVAGHKAGGVADQAARLGGVRKILLAESDGLGHQLAEPLADLVLRLAKNYDVIAAAATSTGKSVLPRVAALLDVMQISEVMEVVSPDTFKRPIYAGNAIETVQSAEVKKVMTIRTASFPAAPGGGASPIETLAAPGDAGLSQFVEDIVAVSSRPELTAARIVVSGGRALGSREKFEQVILPLADKLGAAIGASRAAVDAGYAPNDWQVGQTGKNVAPELYVAIGISGAIQHVAGIKDAKVIVAINSDPDAPIFQLADYGLVGDLFQIVPELQKAL